MFTGKISSKNQNGKEVEVVNIDEDNSYTLVANSLDVNIMKALMAKLELVNASELKKEIEDVEKCLKFFEHDDDSDDEEDEDGNKVDKTTGLRFLGKEFKDTNLKTVGKEAIDGFKLVMILYNAMW